MVLGHGQYSQLYDMEKVSNVTNRDTQQKCANNSGDLRVLQEGFPLSDLVVAGVYFKVGSLSTPTKARAIEKIIWRNVCDLAMTAIHNIKK